MRLADSLNVYFLEFYKLAEDFTPLHKCCKNDRNPYFCRKSVEILSYRPPLLVLYKVHNIFQPRLISVGLNNNLSFSLSLSLLCQRLKEAQLYAPKKINNLHSG